MRTIPWLTAVVVGLLIADCASVASAASDSAGFPLARDSRAPFLRPPPSFPPTLPCRPPPPPGSRRVPTRLPPFLPAPLPPDLPPFPYSSPLSRCFPPPLLSLLSFSPRPCTSLVSAFLASEPRRLMISLGLPRLTSILPPPFRAHPPISPPSPPPPPLYPPPPPPPSHRF